MNTEISRDVILDLLPLYLADEASTDTRAVVEKYLESDPKLAAIARQPSALEIPNNIPISLEEENQMEAYKEAKKTMYWRTIIVAFVIAFFILALLAFAGVIMMFLTSSV
jgi:anti-sigma factor RsiW